MRREEWDLWTITCQKKNSGKRVKGWFRENGLWIVAGVAVGAPASAAGNGGRLTSIR